MKNTTKRATAFLLTLMLLLSVCAVFASANSAPKDFYGSSSNGVITTDENCPITVEKEVLTLDIAQLPDSYYSDTESFLAYTGKVSAEYTFYNPTADTVNATLVFPFGSIPNYAIYYDSEKDEYVYNSDTEKYDVTVNGQKTEKRLRISYTSSAYDFSLEKDLPLLLDNYVTDRFYSPDLPVTKYTYVASIADGNTYRATLDITDSDYDAGKVYLDETILTGTPKKGVTRLYTNAKNAEPLTLYVIGSSPAAPTDWSVYEEDDGDYKETSGDITLVSAESITFAELIRSVQGEGSGIDEIDYYNTTVAYLNGYYGDEYVISS